MGHINLKKGELKVANGGSLRDSKHVNQHGGEIKWEKNPYGLS